MRIHIHVRQSYQNETYRRGERVKEMGLSRPERVMVFRQSISPLRHCIMAVEPFLRRRMNLARLNLRGRIGKRLERTLKARLSFERGISYRPSMGVYPRLISCFWTVSCTISPCQIHADARTTPRSNPSLGSYIPLGAQNCPPFSAERGSSHH